MQTDTNQWRRNQIESGGGRGVDLSKILTSNPQRSNAYVYILFISVPDTGKGQFAISGLILSYVHVFLYLT